MSQEVTLGRAEQSAAETALLTRSSPTTDGPSKKRTCEETSSSPPSNKKTKETIIAVDGLPCKNVTDLDTIATQDDPNAPDAPDSFEHVGGASGEHAGWPLRGINATMTTGNDVFFSNGNAFNDYAGNTKYRKLLKGKKSLYQASEGGDESSIVKDFIGEWRSQDPPGRFISFDKDSCSWNDVGDEAVAKKISMALGKGSRKQQHRDGSESNGTAVTFSDEDQPSADEISDAECVTSQIALSTHNSDIEEHKKGETNRKMPATASNKENVLPHGIGSMYIDVLSFLAATPFDAESMQCLHEHKEHSIMKKSLVLPSRGRLPIIPQKLFMAGKTLGPCPDDIGDKDTKFIEKEASKFLLEAKHLVKSAIPTAKTAATPRGVRPPTKGQHDCQTLPHAPVPKVGYLGSQQCPYPYGYVPPVPWPASWPNVQPTVIHNNFFPANSMYEVLHPLNMPAVATYQVHAMYPQAARKVATAGKGIDTSVAHVQAAAAKMPLSFGFHLNDNNVSKQLAQAAAQTWKTEGRKAAKSKGTAPSVSTNVKDGSAVRKAPKTPKTPKCVTPKTPRTPAILLSTEPATNLPEGWTSKTFRRSSGKTAGHKDTYFYSPKEKIKFRAMTGCKTFVQILAEPGVDGNESSALKVYKEKGLRF